MDRRRRAAIARDATRPKERDPCSLVSRAEAEAALEAPLAKDPVVDGAQCTYTYQPASLPGPSCSNPLAGRHPEFREHAALAAGIVKALPRRRRRPGQAGTRRAGSALTGPWEAAGRPVEFWAVKKDVLIKADAQAAMKQAHARNLVAAAMSKL